MISHRYIFPLVKSTLDDSHGYSHWMFSARRSQPTWDDSELRTRRGGSLQLHFHKIIPPSLRTTYDVLRT